MFILLGLNHRSAPLAMREKLAFTEAELPTVLARLTARPPLVEGMILSTCNRVEILARAADLRGGISAVKAFLGEERGIDPDEIERYCYQYEGLDAVRHVLHVAAGLDSMVLGEPQILGQVKRAYELARTSGATSSVIDHLLQQGIAAAKRIRTETGISRHAVSIAFAAVSLARKIFGDLKGRSVLLLGAGKMTELAARHLTGNGVGDVVVSNRTFSRAQALADAFEGRAVNWDEGFAWLERVDIVVTGTAALEPILYKPQVQQAMKARRSRPLFIIDIAVPRDVDPAVNTLDNVYLYDIDDLQGVVDSNLEERRRAAEDARKRIESEVQAFDRWRQTAEVAPTIAALRDHLHAVGHEEFVRLRRRLGALSPEQERAVEDLTRSVIQKILHPPIIHLKSCSERGEAHRCAVEYRSIFGLPGREAAAEPPAAGEGKGPHRVIQGGKES